jgi:hypothetical protein
MRNFLKIARESLNMKKEATEAAVLTMVLAGLK